MKVANKAMQSLSGDSANFAVACAFLDTNGIGERRQDKHSKESRASDIKGAFTLTVSTAKTMS